MAEEEEDARRAKVAAAANKNKKSAKYYTEQQQRIARENKCKFRASLCTTIPLTVRGTVDKHIFYKSINLNNKQGPLRPVLLKEGDDIIDHRDEKRYKVLLIYMVEGTGSRTMLILEGANKEHIHLAMDSVQQIIPVETISTEHSDACYQQIVKDFEASKAEKSSAKGRKKKVVEQHATRSKTEFQQSTTMSAQLSEVVHLLQELVIVHKQTQEKLDQLPDKIRQQSMEVIEKMAAAHEENIVAVALRGSLHKRGEQEKSKKRKKEVD